MVVTCDGCGAPLEARWTEITVTCRYCGAENTPGRLGDPVPPVVPDDGRLRIHVDGRTYVVEGRLAVGDSSDVFRARWANRLSELVVIKVLRVKDDELLLRNESRILHTLCSEGGYLGRLPRPVAAGPSNAGFVTVQEWRSGFYLTLVDVQNAHPGGIDGRIVVWIWKRTLELLAWAHRHRIAHGAVVPPHVLIHPRAHGAMLVGWTGAAPIGERTMGWPAAWEDVYPKGALHDRRASPVTDIAMSARCVQGLADVPRPMRRLLEEAADGRHADAWALCERVTAVSRDVFGPPAYVPLPMPGW